MIHITFDLVSLVKGVQNLLKQHMQCKLNVNNSICSAVLTRFLSVNTALNNPGRSNARYFAFLLHLRVWVTRWSNEACLLLFLLEWRVEVYLVLGFMSKLIIIIFCSISSSVLDIWFLVTLLLYITEDNDTANLVTEPDKIDCMSINIFCLLWY